jgi:hypothetical protein
MSIGSPTRSRFQTWYAEHEERGESLAGQDLARAAWNAAINTAAECDVHLVHDERLVNELRRGDFNKAVASIWDWYRSRVKLLRETEKGHSPPSSM